MQDRIFRGIAQRFVRNIYGTRKGRIRLEILWRDLQEEVPGIAGSEPLHILDVGAGLGQISQKLARLGHRPVLIEPGNEMRALARQYWHKDEATRGMLRVFNQRLQDLPDSRFPPSDLVLCHAVLEWLAEPRAAMPILVGQVRPGGWLSLMFYNRQAAVWSNLMRGNLKRVLSNQFRGRGKTLAPINPLMPDQVLDWGRSEGLELVSYSGVRCFVDYMQAEAQDSELIETEWMLSRQEPYRSLARYIHCLFRRPSVTEV